MKWRAFIASAVIAGFLSGMPALVQADEHHHGWGVTTNTTSGIPAARGSSIIQIGFGHITRNGR